MKYKIGDIVTDTDGKQCRITNITSNSIEVFLTKKTKKGIDCYQWFTIDRFEKRFKWKVN